LYKRLGIGILILFVIAVGAYFGLVWRAPIAPVDGRTSTAFDPSLVARGAVLASGGYCMTCHTAKGRPAFSGGYAMKTPFGTMYSSNITPDPTTGIGTWSEAAFTRALREGVARDGTHLFPAFPFDHYTKLSDADVHALYAFFMTREPVNASPPPNTVRFPFDIRDLQVGWKLLFLHDARFHPDVSKSAEWNRGAYLAEALSHCSACHTPRNMMGAEKGGAAYAGAFVDGWYAPPLTSANPAPLQWTEKELYGYLRDGGTALHGATGGPMSEAVAGLRDLPDSDVHAIAVYFADLDGSTRVPQPDAATLLAKAIKQSSLGIPDQAQRGASIYRAACAYCHFNSSEPPLLLRPELALSTALHADNPTNLVQVVLNGISREGGIKGGFMPGFANALSDADIAALANYLRSTRTDKKPWPDLQAQVTRIRQSNE